MVANVVEKSRKGFVFFNVCPHEVIHNVFYSKKNESLITIYVYASKTFNSIKNSSTKIEYIRKGVEPDADFPLFQ